jgi:GMP synthase (glutamine-hydrolysing)
MEKKEFIAILDFGSQYTQLIARRIREENVYCEIFNNSISAEKLKTMAPKGIILSGGPYSIYSKGSPNCDEGIFQLGIPVLGICYGMQLMVHLLGGKVERWEEGSYGYSEAVLSIKEPGEIFNGLKNKLQVWMSYGDVVDELPQGFRVLANTNNIPVVAIADIQRGFYGLQFHPEVPYTQKGKDILKSFIFRICGSSREWTVQSFIKNKVKEIREKIGDGRVVCGLSGGVDSSAAALLVHKAIGDKLTCIFVNNGLLRKGEAESVVETFKDNFKLNLKYIDASERFLKKLAGIVDPELKRKIIGEEFIRVFEEEADKLGKTDYLVQGTLYPDVIESSAAFTGSTVRVKSHHNVGGLPEKMSLKLIEPFAELFKDEVRKIAGELGLPKELVGRHPFPGPGLGVRVIGDITEERLEILREADAIVIEEIKKAGLYEEIWQAFAVLTSTRTVGVTEDQRTYDYVVAVRAVKSEDGMTCDWVRLPYDVLNAISSRIVNEVSGVNRVVYDISSKPPSTIEWE